MTSYSNAGDYKGVLSYGIGVGGTGNNPGDQVRVPEVEKIEQGQHVYVVAVQLDTTFWQ